ncbi:apotyrosinase chaperone MelC1 [Streptomyces sp. KLOTTS4A1]|uniref:apotyrosinase chaperone MelC1 n=1 Tax=Streptomyces sp. KLOTTS4A1 TaxID=3390996 RepID=UPI0039F61D61
MSTITRRHALGAALGTVAATTAAGPLISGPALADSRQAPAQDGGQDLGRDRAHGSSTFDLEPFDEVYQGRHIQGAPSRDGGHHGGHGGGHHGGHGTGYTVHIDGQELHLMRNADGTWISVINHYEPVATPRASARAAVRELQGARLVPLTAP